MNSKKITQSFALARILRQDLVPSVTQRNKVKLSTQSVDGLCTQFNLTEKQLRKFIIHLTGSALETVYPNRKGVHYKPGRKYPTVAEQRAKASETKPSVRAQAPQSDDQVDVILDKLDVLLARIEKLEHRTD